jgi:K+-sensing histidine kinase KdpD
MRTARRQLDDLIENVLAMSRLDSGALGLNVTRVRIRDLVGAVSRDRRAAHPGGA